jgi:single-stranded-DNA-specific exonuclease
MFAGTQKLHRKSAFAGTDAKLWAICPPSPDAKQLAAALKVSPLLAQILINRGVSDAGEASQFLRPKLADLIRPEKMPGVQNALPVILRAIEEKQKITVYGDYDVDGITGTAILWHLFGLLGADADFYIPHRIDEGYGLNTDAVRLLAKNGTKLLITVDCGINADDSAKLAKKLNVGLIITDHHQPAATLPAASAIVHPALDPTYPNQDSAGSLVAFKLAWALANKINGETKLDPTLRNFFINATSLAAMGTIADVVSLRGENRILASFGLKTLPESSLPGIAALIETAGLAGETIDSFHIGFRLAPMLNAAGRMGHARLAVELLTTDKPARAKEIAEYLKSQNTQRQQIEKKIFKAACEIIKQKGLNSPDRKTIVLADDNWHTGIIGIVASRIVDKFNKPAILINSSPVASLPDRPESTEGEPAEKDEKLAQGSARSVPGFDILAAIAACSNHLAGFGGHKMAAGLKIEPEKIERFADSIEKYAQQNTTAPFTATLHIDVDSALSELSPALIKEMQMLEPFGQGNPQPLFATKAVRLCSPPRKCGANGDHLQLAITDNKKSIRCVGFRFAPFEKKLLEHDCFHVAYHPQINTYNGSSSVELVLADIQFDND